MWKLDKVQSVQVNRDYVLLYCYWDHSRGADFPHESCTHEIRRTLWDRLWRLDFNKKVDKERDKFISKLYGENLDILRERTYSTKRAYKGR